MGCVLAFVPMLGVSASHAKPEYAKKENKPCKTCHDMSKGMPKHESPNLNKVGECYQKNGHKDLDKCEAQK